MNNRTQRRRFLQNSALAGVGFWAVGHQEKLFSMAPLEKIRFACVGVGGRGYSNVMEAAKHGEVVALCDVDEIQLEKTTARQPNAKVYHDYRKMFDAMHKDIDAVVISTPDHTHAVIAAAAIGLRKHCYIEKPLARTVYESRQLGALTLGLKVATQMGNQGVATPKFREALDLLKRGALGTIKEVHCWTNRPIWQVNQARPAKVEVPKHLHWDLWLGPAPERPFGAGYHPFNWRGWWDFGTGALGDFGCHTMNLPFMALDLRDPTSVEADTTPHNKESFPKSSTVVYQFPKRDQRPALTLTWYDGGRLPPAELFQGEKIAGGGCLIVGEKGKLYDTSGYGAMWKLLGNIDAGTASVSPSVAHFEEFVRSMRGQSKALSNLIDYAAPLTETVLLGNLAVWAGKKIEWDAAQMKAKGIPELEELIRPKYRIGYSL